MSVTNTIQLQAALDQAFLLFCVCWILWGAASHLLLYRNRPVAFRRVWHPRVALISAAAFLAFLVYIVALGFDRRVLYVFGPALLLITYLNIRDTRFCDACGQTFKMNLLKAPSTCRHCGAAL